MRGTRAWLVLLALLGVVASVGCGDDDGGDDDDDDDDNDDGGMMTSDDPPDDFTKVADEDDGFTSPSDAVVSPDGDTIYFSAFRASDRKAALFSVPSSGGAVTDLGVTISGGELGYVSGLEISPDGDTLYLADSAGGADADGAIYRVASSGGAATLIESTGVLFPNALGINDAGDVLVVVGVNSTAQPAIFRVDPATGATSTITAGGPLRSPSGVYVDPSDDDVVYLLDHLARADADGEGTVFKIEGSDIDAVATGMLLGTPAGLSFTSKGGLIVVSGRDPETREAGLFTIEGSGGVSFTAFPEAAAILDPAGLRSARGAGVFAIVDSEGNAVYRGD